MVNKMLKKHYMAFNCLDLHSFLSPRIIYTAQCVQTDLQSSFVPRQAETSFNRFNGVLNGQQCGAFPLMFSSTPKDVNAGKGHETV